MYVQFPHTRSVPTVIFTDEETASSECEICNQFDGDAFVKHQQSDPLNPPHVFHKKCLIQHFIQTQSCPSCDPSLACITNICTEDEIFHILIIAQGYINHKNWVIEDMKEHASQLSSSIHSILSVLSLVRMKQNYTNYASIIAITAFVQYLWYKNAVIKKLKPNLREKHFETLPREIPGASIPNSIKANIVLEAVSKAALAIIAFGIYKEFILSLPAYKSSPAKGLFKGIGLVMIEFLAYRIASKYRKWFSAKFFQNPQCIDPKVKSTIAASTGSIGKPIRHLYLDELGDDEMHTPIRQAFADYDCGFFTF